MAICTVVLIMNTIVTHLSPDTDAITSIWLIKRFLSGWSKAATAFVPAGSTLNGLPPDDNPHVLHVDTGMGKFDHHQSNEDTCAAQKVLEFLIAEGHIKKNYIEPLERMIAVVNDIDHFREVFLPEPDNDMFDFLLMTVIEGVKIKLQDDEKIVLLVQELLDGLLSIFFNKVHAESEIGKGLIFESKWGRTIAIESDNEEVARLAQKKGFRIVIRKTIKKGIIRIKALPLAKIDITPLGAVLKRKDPSATWFVHASGHMILNGSAKNPNTIPSRLSLSEVVALMK